jgi:hypothetical protein
MKSSVIAAVAGCTIALDVQPIGHSGVVESIDSEPLAVEESSISIPPHPLGVKPSGNQYTATSNARHRVGRFQLLPDEILAISLEYLDSQELRLLGYTCKFLHAFCRSEDLWKTLFIE